MFAGAQQQIQDKSSNSFSAGFVGGVAVGCIVITAVIIFIALLILRRFNPEKVCEFIWSIIFVTSNRLPKLKFKSWLPKDHFYRLKIEYSLPLHYAI